MKLFYFFRSHRDIQNDLFINIPFVVQNIGLTPNRRHAIILKNMALLTDAYVGHLASMS